MKEIELCGDEKKRQYKLFSVVEKTSARGA